MKKIMSDVFMLHFDILYNTYTPICERKYTGAVFSHALIYGSHEDVSVILSEFSGRFKYIYLHLLKPYPQLLLLL